MVPLFVLILIAAVLWRQRHRPTAKTSPHAKSEARNEPLLFGDDPTNLPAYGFDFVALIIPAGNPKTARDEDTATR